MNNLQASQEQGIPFDPTLYAQRIEKGLLYWGEENGTPVLYEKRFDLAQNELPPVKFYFSTLQIDKIRLDYDEAAREVDRQVANLQRQILDLQERKENILKEKASICDALEIDIKKIEAEIVKKSK